VPWAVFVLLLANVIVAAYLAASGAPSGLQTDARAVEVNAARITPLRAAVTQAPAHATKEPAAKPGPNACLEWGSFGAAELERAQADIARLGADRSSARDLGLAAAWWVHVPPLPSRAEAERRAREIEEAGVTDVRVVADGERWRNAISLGIFKSGEAANAYLARMKEAQVRNVAVAQRNDLLRLASILIVEPPPALVARISELRAAYPGTELRAVGCGAGAG
jgi:hypothetical protein